MSSTTDPSAVPDGPRAPRIRRKKPAKALFASTTLLLEAFVVLFATLVAYGLRQVPGTRDAWAGWAGVPSTTAIWVAGGTLALVLVVLSRAVSAPGGYLAGSIVQVPVLASGIVVPMMFVVGGLFVVLWIVSLRLGGRIDRERAEYDRSHPETAPNVG
ncbi:DUF4233 domain-containing protein [Oerskovia flava]|uniref:DUF4233 domain-containing protein n=1 Tax=Oerskovia flava TaxID=2986422 RepID=UPI002AD2979F|nr:DUF4233 domain-containing protein [Oerskovia sp. JB1-3-2]